MAGLQFSCEVRSEVNNVAWNLSLETREATANIFYRTEPTYLRRWRGRRVENQIAYRIFVAGSSSHIIAGLGPGSAVQ